MSKNEDLSHFQSLGGQAALAEIIDDFVERVRSDIMIGFFFRKVKLEQLKLLERQFAETHLGGPATYEGRGLRAAHASHKIMGGQFNRRLRILEKCLDDHGVDPTIRDAWLAHNESLRAHITRDRTDECVGADPRE